MNLVLITFVYGGFQYLVSARPSVSEETIQGKCKPQDAMIKDEMHQTYDESDDVSTFFSRVKFIK